MVAPELCGDRAVFRSSTLISLKLGRLAPGVFDVALPPAPSETEQKEWAVFQTMLDQREAEERRLAAQAAVTAAAQAQAKREDRRALKKKKKEAKAEARKAVSDQMQQQLWKVFQIRNAQALETVNRWNVPAKTTVGEPLMAYTLTPPKVGERSGSFC